jgi:hypothetical protein
MTDGNASTTVFPFEITAQCRRRACPGDLDLYAPDLKFPWLQAERTITGVAGTSRQRHRLE